ncbi:MobF family relaxase [Aureimonas ureilytica]|uniref:MobF family relaxase n=1 Tax=Aureimonas ureilytica TaxID=401562 RepID=UPI0007345CF8|nr:MobF family relaxase [Aureimonas ureilytica]
MVATVSAGTSARYYTAQIEYYLGGREPDGHWLLAGPGLGVIAASVVDNAAFERLHAAVDASGRSLLGNQGGGGKEAVGGYDVTFSAPKSLSVRWGLAEPLLRVRLEAAQLTAVGIAVDHLDRQAAFCRRGKNGTTLERVQLTAAAFQHGEARPAPHADGMIFASPALHTHVNFLNIARRADGTFGRLDGRLFYAWKMAAGAVYHQALAAELVKLGFAVEVTGKNGLFEIAGVDPALCAYFSARRREIEDELAAIGLETAQAPALAAAKARATRRSKTLEGVEDRHALWRERAAGLGFVPEHVAEQALAVDREWAVAHDVAPPEQRPSRAVLAELTERDSLFEHRQLVAAVAASQVGAETIVSIDDELAALRADGALVELGRDRWGHGIYSTPDVVQLEQDLYARAARLALAEVRAPSPRRVERLLAAAGLNAEQEAAARLAYSSRAIITVEGAPGVGKTTLLAPVAKAWEASGWRVIGASTAWKIAHQLRDELGIEAKAIDSWLTGAEHGRAFLTDKTLLVIDEAGLITGRQMNRILAEVERAREAGLEVAVRMVGDRRQLQPIGGPGLSIVTDAIGTQRVDTIVRQRESWMRDVVTAFGDGRAADALASLDARGCVHACDGPAATVAALVEAWDRWRREHAGESGLLIAKTNAQVAALNRTARLRLRASGDLASVDAGLIEAVTPSGQPHTLALAVGERVRFLVRNDRLGLVNGTEARLERVERRPDGVLRLHARVGGHHGGERAVTFTPADIADEHGRAHLAHAYATTCYGSQGLTTEGAFVLADPAMDRHDIHVAASRARGTTQLFVDHPSLDARVKAERLLADRERVVEPEERRDALAAALARSGVKRTTLDYLTPTQKRALIEQAHELRLERGRGRVADRRRERPEEERPGTGDERRVSAADRHPSTGEEQVPAVDGPARTPDDRAPSRRRGRSKDLSLE